MSNEQTKTPGQIAYEADGYFNWDIQNKYLHERWERIASAVISRVLQGGKYILLPEKATTREGDEKWFLQGMRGWTKIAQPGWKVFGDAVRRPLPQSAEPELIDDEGFPYSAEPAVEEKSDADPFLQAIRQRDEALDQRDQLRKELESVKHSLYETNESYEKAVHDRDAAVRDCRKVTAENAALRKRVNLDPYPALTQAVLNAKDEEITRLRSQFRWTPISERLPTEKDADKQGCVWILQPDSRQAPARPIREIHWTNLNSDDPHVWMTPIALPFVSPPETEEQASDREFQAWWSKISEDWTGIQSTSWFAEKAWKAAKKSQPTP